MFFKKVLFILTVLFLLTGCSQIQKDNTSENGNATAKPEEAVSHILTGMPISSAEMTKYQIAELKDILKLEGLKHEGALCLPCDSAGNIKIHESNEKISIITDSKISDFEMILKYEGYTLLIYHLDMDYIQYAEKSVRDYIAAKNPHANFTSDGKFLDSSSVKYLDMDIGNSKVNVQIAADTESAFSFIFNNKYLIILHTKGIEKAQQIFKDLYFTEVSVSILEG